MKNQKRKNNKKITCIGDIHGSTLWKNIVENEKDSDLFIFIGDYFDTKNTECHGQKQIDNFKDIIDFKINNMDRVILLVGNHDFHYIRGVGETYTGYQGLYAIDIGIVVESAIRDKLIQLCYLEDDYFFSHAGLTKTWVKHIIAPNNINPLVSEVMVNILNDYLRYQPRIFGFNSGPNRSKTGNDITQGPLWVRPYSLMQDMLEEVIFVVGHTQVDNITILEKEKLILIDCLKQYQYLVINNGKPQAKEIKF
jgi:predicted MPP superfamily phosphohydrolase